MRIQGKKTFPLLENLKKEGKFKYDNMKIKYDHSDEIFYILFLNGKVEICNLSFDLPEGISFDLKLDEVFGEFEVK